MCMLKHNLRGPGKPLLLRPLQHKLQLETLCRIGRADHRVGRNPQGDGRMVVAADRLIDHQGRIFGRPPRQLVAVPQQDNELARVARVAQEGDPLQLLLGVEVVGQLARPRRFPPCR